MVLAGDLLFQTINEITRWIDEQIEDQMNVLNSRKTKQLDDADQNSTNEKFIMAYLREMTTNEEFNCEYQSTKL